MIINLEQKTHTFWHSDCEAKYAPSMKRVSTRSTTSQPNIVEILVECTACEKQGLYPRGQVGPINVEEYLSEVNKMEVTVAEKEISKLESKISEIKLQYGKSTAQHDDDLRAAMKQIEHGIAEYNLLVKKANNNREAAEQAIAMLNVYAPKWLKIELKTTDEEVE